MTKLTSLPSLVERGVFRLTRFRLKTAKETKQGNQGFFVAILLFH
uniref:Uncharacterized protein n=1 Tax=Anguilla anguilla TaxID=7936 RepID=A0A0E9XF20_ANGAN